VEQRRDEYSFHRFAKLAEEYPELVTRTPYVYCWNKEGGYPDPWYRDLVFDVRYALLLDSGTDHARLVPESTSRRCTQESEIRCGIHFIHP
jgi:hypothetical protein